MNANVPANITVQNARLPATYEAAKTALASCANIDECQDWANKAEALASYARMADDDTLRKLADRIQARAVRRLGELLKQYDAQGQRTDQLSEGAHTKLSQKDAAEQAGISKHQQVQAVRVANVPQDQFDKAVDSTTPATVTKLAEMGKQTQAPRQIDPSAVAARESVEKFADFCLKNDPLFVVGGVGPSLVPKMRSKVATIDAWLDQFIVGLKD